MASTTGPIERRTWMPAYACTIIVVTTVLLGIRLVSRLHKFGGGLGLDDIFIVLGYVVAVAHAISVIYSE
jgi:hypothetical protein